MNKSTVKNWILKAENDLKTGKDELATGNPATDTVCFHMQQCAEKCLKAFLVFHNLEIRKTHDIAELIELCTQVDPEFEYLLDLKVDELTKYAIEIRYPDDFYFPSIDESRHAVELAQQVKDFVLKKLQINGGEEISPEL